MTYEHILRTLTERGITFTMHEHAPVRSVEESRTLLPFDVQRYLKTLAFRTRECRWILAAMRGLDRLDYRRLVDAVGVPRSAIRAATPEEVVTALGCEPGAVCPIPAHADVIVLLDDAAVTMDAVYTGSGRADRTLEIGMADLLTLVQPRVLPLRREDANG